jgi:hypothetical protein
MRLAGRLTTGAASANPATHHTPEDVCERNCLLASQNGVAGQNDGWRTNGPS